MILVYGGAWQGKLDWVKKEYGIRDDEVFRCSDKEMPDLSAKVIYGIEEFLKREQDSEEFFRENLECLRDKIIVCRDISQGLVPVEPEERQWRERTGRTMIFLAGKADKVFRIFCGLSQEIK